MDFNKIGDIDGMFVLKFTAYIVFATILLVSGIWCAHYRYVDCLKVGHTKMYCIMSMGK